MYQAKQRGGSRFELYSAEIGQAVRKRLQMANELRSAIQAGAIEVAFQPIVATETGSTVAVEALARWTSPTYGVVSPDTFIPLAESTGQILALDDLVRSKTMSQLRGWVERGLAVPVHINVSPLRLMLADFERDLAASVAAAGVSNELVVFEITESTLVDGSGDVVDALTWLREQGFGLAADDFGAGYSMLNYLKRLPLTVVKTDRSFVEDMATERDRTILRRVIMLGHDLGYQVVVEGIETEEQRHLVDEGGADACQGFLFSRPLTPEQTTQFLRDSRR
jgi:EAL domain-containing protein (putative c-di-GMP-specific phosphodiesterase class I)